MVIELRDARKSADDAEWLTNVYPFYLHDLSEFDEGYYRLGDRGRWEPDHLPSWLHEPTDHPLVIVDAGQRVGCALVNEAPSAYLRPGMDFRMSEFFVLRKHRRRGVGRHAVFALFDRFPGKWEISELARNAPAIGFWRRVIGEYSGGHYEETATGTEVRQFVDTRHREDRGR
ncbi:MAG TPA: GNAT family N-acetyltransferase [Methylomirabilota bacterium]|jgi:predicted acetyltransferase|nr:GNAT family N-acetyltransferase [Methylomirabilota bacterium]